MHCLARVYAERHHIIMLYNHKEIRNWKGVTFMND